MLQYMQAEETLTSWSREALGLTAAADVVLRHMLLLSLVQHTRGEQAICASQPVRGYPALAQSMSVEPYLELQRR